MLGEADRVDFPYLKALLQLTDGNLGRHIEVLAAEELVRVTKGYEGRRPRTWVEITKLGRGALAAEMDALKQLVQRYEQRHLRSGPAPPRSTRPRRLRPVRPRPGLRASTLLALPGAPAVAVGLLVAVYVAIFGWLTWAQHANFGTFGYDMGLYDQGIWLLSRFQDPFVTIRGLSYFEHHVNLVTVLFVPAYWLGAGPQFLYLVETVWMALGAVPLFLLARDRLHSGWLAVAVAGCFLLYPSLEWINWWHFHPDALVITPLLFAWWLATRRRWGWFAVAVGVALACKEDAALAVLMLGLVLAVLGERRAGLLTAAAGAGWFLLATRVVIPAVGGGDGPFYQELFPGFGDSLGEIVWNMAVHPSRLLDLATLPDRLDYYWKVLAPVAFFPLAAPLVLLISVPQTVVNVTSGHVLTHDFRFHYTAIVLAGVFLATVEGMAWAGRGRDRPPGAGGGAAGDLGGGQRRLVAVATGPPVRRRHLGQGRAPPCHRAGGPAGRAAHRRGVGLLQPDPAPDPPDLRLRVPQPLAGHQLGRPRREPARSGHRRVPGDRRAAPGRPAAAVRTLGRRPRGVQEGVRVRRHRGRQAPAMTSAT